MPTDIEFKGLDEIVERFEDIADVSGIEAALKKACFLVEREAKIKAPKVDGDLRRSITSRIEGTEGIVYSPLEYAPYVEYGTGLFSEHPKGGRKDVPWVYQDEKTKEFIRTYGQHAQPYLHPALDENREEILRILREGMKNG